MNTVRIRSLRRSFQRMKLTVGWRVKVFDTKSL
jgi:hypothetical protein